MAFFPFQFPVILSCLPFHIITPVIPSVKPKTFIKCISLGVYEYDQYLLSYKWSLMKWRVFLEFSEPARKSIFVLGKKKKSIRMLNTDQTATFTFQKKLRGQKLGKFGSGPSSQATQTTRGISYLTLLIGVKIDFTQTGAL